MSLMDKINEFLNESISDIKKSKQAAIGLEHISFNNYKDKSGRKYFWSITAKNFLKLHDKDQEIVDVYKDRIRERHDTHIDHKGYWDNKVKSIEQLFKENYRLDVEVEQIHEDKQSHRGDNDVLEVKLHGKKIAKVVGGHLKFTNEFLKTRINNDSKTVSVKDGERPKSFQNIRPPKSRYIGR